MLVWKCIFGCSLSLKRIINELKKLEWTQPKTNTVGIQLPINKLCDLLRPDIAAAGYCEALTFALVSRADIGEKMGLEKCPDTAVHVSNPKTYEFQVRVSKYHFFSRRKIDTSNLTFELLSLWKI